MAADTEAETKASRVRKLINHKKRPLDGTYYIGKKSNPVMLRIMDKTTDKRNPKKNTFEVLDARENRARIEVTCLKANGEMGAPATLGLETPEDLYGFKFQALRKRIFDFYLPTIGMDPDNGKGSRQPDPDELEVFSRTGVYGLDEYQTAGNLLLRRQHEKGLSDISTHGSKL